MKAYSFYFNASDWLASGSVKLMSKAERGAYIDLLAIAWRQPIPGTLPASEEKVRRLSELSREEWAESGETLLEMFPLSEDGSYRYNPRLIQEAEKQRELSEKNAENGRKSAERRAAEKAVKEAAAAQAQRKANENPTTVAPNPTTVEFEVNETSTKLSQAKQSSKEDEEREQGSSSAPEPEPLKDKTPKRTLPPPPDDAQLFTADNWPGLVNPATFASICTDLRLPIDLDRETYRAAIQDKMRSLKMEAISSTMRSWVSSFFILEKKKGPLLSLTVGLPTVPTPRHELPPNGKERPGQIIAIEGVPHDANMNRMKVASFQDRYPTAQIHAILPRQN